MILVSLFALVLMLVVLLGKDLVLYFAIVKWVATLTAALVAVKKLIWRAT